MVVPGRFYSVQRTYHQKTFSVEVTAVVIKLETESCVMLSSSSSGKTWAGWVSDWTREGTPSSTDTASRDRHMYMHICKLVIHKQTIYCKRATCTYMYMYMYM